MTFVDAVERERQGVWCDPDHRYWAPDGRELLSVSRGLDPLRKEAEATYYTPASRQRGTDVHDALLVHFEGGQPALSDTVRPYWAHLLTFLRDGEFEVESAEQIVADLDLGYAGRYDFLGWFGKFGHSPLERDLVDVKTGSVPRTVGPQTAAYARPLRSRCGVIRRWVLHVTPERYRVIPLNLQPAGTRVDRGVDKRDEADFLAGLRVAQFRRFGA